MRPKATGSASGTTGLGVMAFGLMYGAIYVLLGRDARTSYLAMLAAFVI